MTELFFTVYSGKYEIVYDFPHMQRRGVVSKAMCTRGKPNSVTPTYTQAHTHFSVRPRCDTQRNHIPRMII